MDEKSPDISIAYHRRCCHQTSSRRDQIKFVCASHKHTRRIKTNIPQVVALNFGNFQPRTALPYGETIRDGGTAAAEEEMEEKLCLSTANRAAASKPEKIA